MTELQFADEKNASRYTLHKGSDLVSVLDYRDDGRTIALTRAYTIPTFRGHGYAGELVERVVDDLERRGDRVVSPVCWYVADWFEAHPDRAGIVAERRASSVLPAPRHPVKPLPARARSGETCRTIHRRVRHVTRRDDAERA